MMKTEHKCGRTLYRLIQGTARRLSMDGEVIDARMSLGSGACLPIVSISGRDRALPTAFALGFLIEQDIVPVGFELQVVDMGRLGHGRSWFQIVRDGTPISETGCDGPTGRPYLFAASSVQLYQVPATRAAIALKLMAIASGVSGVLVESHDAGVERVSSILISARDMETMMSFCWKLSLLMVAGEALGKGLVVRVARPSDLLMQIDVIAA
jgi:hypothetical protein